MKKILIFLLLPLAGIGQNTIGLPDVINYSRYSYSAGLQNWDFKQDKNGIVYAANNEGLLSFDGRYWNVYPLPNRTIVRSIEIGEDNRIYVGGQDELGYFEPGKTGKLEYHSLTPLIQEKFKFFGDVWDIVAYKKSVFFRARTEIFQFSNQAIASFQAPSDWLFLGVSNDRLYAHDAKTGLLQFSNNIWSPLGNAEVLPLNDPITAILPLRNDSAVITTLKNSLYILVAGKTTKVTSPNNLLFQNERIYAATSIDSSWIALATSSGGVYITDIKGNIIQHFSRTEGLQNNNVLSIFLDAQHNLWLGLDNGIDFISYNSAVKHISPLLQDESGYTSIIHEGKLYLGTSNNLYSVALQPVKDLSFSKGNFQPVKNAKGQNWTLAEINNQLLLGHHEGAFQIKGNATFQLSQTNGFWNFIPTTGTFPIPKVIAGNYGGLYLFEFSSNQFNSPVKIPGFSESSRFVAIDRDDNIWVSHPFHGIFRITQKADGTYSTTTFTSKNGLPSDLNNHIYKVKNEVVVASEKGIYLFDVAKGLFAPSDFYRKLLGDQSIRYLKEDKEGNIWFIHEKTLGVIDFTGKEPVVIYLPELNSKMLSGFENIYSVDKNNILLGGEKGFYNINFEKYKQNAPALKVQVRNVRMIDMNDSTLFGGYFSNVNDSQVQIADKIPEVDYKWKTIRFEYSSAVYGFQSNLEFSTRLRGFEENWSNWTNRTEKEYTNLPEGKYVFEVRVRNNLGNESAPATFVFKVLPPWYRTTWSYLLYFLLFIGGIVVLNRMQRKKFLLQKKQYEEEQAKLLYIHELELNKTASELVALRNEKLESDLGFKNSELASSGMHLVKKGELLAKIKNELAQVIKRIDNEYAISELRKIIKTLSEDEHLDEEWENFAKHFDTVHSDFVVRLKEKHPNITANELKLCAYLRMNLSTKEIAQLMNISVRGVEISRYRLRKKLGIASEVNLFDYLITVGEK
ncbi:MAG: transcriptional regulator [Chitinophagaceae bacterium]|nr:transcriptional regulator [Chitinophagaceae bacterium]